MMHAFTLKLTRLKHRLRSGFREQAMPHVQPYKLTRFKCAASAIKGPYTNGICLFAIRVIADILY
jgi:hypothetical protein